MADRGGARGGFGSRGDRGGDRGRRGRRGARRGGGKSEEKEWQPVTKLGRLVKAGKIKSMEEIYLHSLAIKEYQIVDFFLPKLKDEVMKVSGDFFAIVFEMAHWHMTVYTSNYLVHLDQTSPETDSGWSAYTIQGCGGHWRLRGTYWARHQDIERSCDRHSGSHNHSQALSGSD